MSTMHESRPLAVVDDGSRLAALSVAWRTWSDAGERAEAEAERRRHVVGRAASAVPAPDGPVETRWTSRDGAEVLTALLPVPGATPWMTRLLEFDQFLRPQGADRPDLAVVGPQDVVDGLSGALRVDGPSRTAESLVSRMVSTRHAGLERVDVTGADPAGRAGHAATFVAMCRAVAGADAAVPASMAQSGLPAQVEVARVLVSGRPAVRWTFAAPGSSMRDALSTMIAAFDAELVAADEAGLDRARELARAELGRLRRSPRELATAMAEFEVMGWGGHLVRDADAALDGATPTSVGRASAALVQPVADVVGR